MTTTMLFDSVGHVDNEALDLYCAERLSPEDDLAVRQHLLVCEDCRRRAQRESSFRNSVRDNRDLFSRPRPRESERRGRRFSPDLFFAWWPALALAATLAAVLLLPRGMQMHSTEPVEVTLQAMRGRSTESGPAGHPLRIRLDLTGVADRSDLVVQIVDRAGRLVADGEAAVESEHACFVWATASPAGQYWVRLVRSGATLREYSLPVR